MAGRDRGFAEFVDTRGPALWRMATLLELEPSAAEHLVGRALSDVRRRWSSLERDGTAEQVVRVNMASIFVDERQRAGEADVVGSAAESAAPRRAALFSLTPRQRVLLVLPTYGGVDTREVSQLAGGRGDEAGALTERAEAAFRGRLADTSPATPLLSLLDDAALVGAPSDLTATVLAAQRPRRRGRAVAAAVVAVGVVVGVAVSPLGWGSGADEAEALNSEWGLPAAIDVTTGLLSLDEAPIGRASGALVVDGTPVVIDAATGEARAVFDDSSDLGSQTTDRGGHGMIRQNWTQVVLSPDGRSLLLVRPRPVVADAYAGRAAVTTGELFLVDIPSADVTAIDELNPSPDPTGTAGIAQPRLAWAPDSGSFACACGGKLLQGDGWLSIGVLGDSGLREVSHTARQALAVAWGTRGPAVLAREGGWAYTDLAAAETSPFIYTTSIAITASEPTMYLDVSALTIYALGADKRPDGGHCTLWDADFSYPISVLSVAERGGTLCTPMTLQPGRRGFVLVLLGAGSDAAERPFDVVVVDRDGSSEVISTVPRETTAASFAAELVG